MKAMILAAGGGTRLHPLTFALPKPMAPLLNRPVMEYIIKHLKTFGFNELIVNLHSLPEHIEGYFGNGNRLGVKITYSHEKEPLGTAGGVKKVGHLFNDTFLVIGGDDLCDINLEKILKFHKEKKSIATIGLTQEEDVEHYGVVVTDENGRISEFQEKPEREEAKSNWVNTGIYIFEPEILDHIPDNTFYDFGSQLFPILKNKKSPFYGCKCEGYWKDIGKLTDYRQAHLDSLTGQVKIDLPGTEIKKGIRAETGIEIAENVKITPPVYIGKNCRIASNTVIEGPVVMGDNNTIEKGSHIKGSVLWNENHVKNNVTLINCLVGNNCQIPENQSYQNTILGCEMKHILKNYFQTPQPKTTPQ